MGGGRWKCQRAEGIAPSLAFQESKKFHHHQSLTQFLWKFLFTLSHLLSWESCLEGIAMGGLGIQRGGQPAEVGHGIHSPLPSSFTGRQMLQSEPHTDPCSCKGVEAVCLNPPDEPWPNALNSSCLLELSPWKSQASISLSHTHLSYSSPLLISKVSSKNSRKN